MIKSLNLISIANKSSDRKHKRKSVFIPFIKSDKYVQKHKEMFYLYFGIEKIIYFNTKNLRIPS